MSIRHRAHRRRTASLLACMGLSLAFTGTHATPALAASVEGGSAFSELTSKAQQESEKAATTTTSTAARESSSTGTSKGVIILALAAAVLLLAGIAFVIVRDARGVAPAGDGPLTEGAATRHSAAQQRRRRAKAKAARAQRKRNR